MCVRVDVRRRYNYRHADAVGPENGDPGADSDSCSGEEGELSPLQPTSMSSTSALTSMRGRPGGGAGKGGMGASPGRDGKDLSIHIQGEGVEVLAYAATRAMHSAWLKMLQGAAAGRLPVSDTHSHTRACEGWRRGEAWSSYLHRTAQAPQKRRNYVCEEGRVAVGIDPT